MTLMRRLFKQNPTMKNLIRLMTSYLTNPHGTDMPVFQEIWDAVRRFPDIPRNNEKEMQDVIALITDALEEGEDPKLPNPHDPVPHQFIEDVCSRAQESLGIDDLSTVKLWLLRIYFAKDAKEEIGKFRELGGTPERVRELFDRTVPRPNTGLFADTNIEEDSLRAVRYFYVCGLLQRQCGNFQEARRRIQIAVNWSLETAQDPIYHERRGQEGVVDLVLNHVRMLIELADLTQEMGMEVEPLAYLAQAAATQLSQMERLGLHPSYVNYLRFMSSNPGFTPAEFDRFVRSNPNIPLNHLPEIATILRIKALASSQKNLERAIRFVDAGLHYIRTRAQSLPQPLQEEYVIKKTVYKLLLEGFRVKLLHPSPDSLLHLRANIEFVREVKLRQLEDVVDEMYPHCLEQIITLINAMSNDPTQAKAMQEAVQMFKEVYGNPQLEYYLQPFAADLYEILGRNSLNYGQLADFIQNMFLSHFMEHLHEKKTQRDGELDKDLDTVLDSLKEHLQSKMQSADNDMQRQLEKVIDILYGNMSGLCKVLLVLGNINKQSKVRSLKEQSYATFLENYEQHISMLKLLLESSLVQEALGEVLEDLKQDRTFFTENEESSDSSNHGDGCPRRGRRYVLGTCISTTEEDETGATMEEVEQTMNSMDWQVEKESLGNAVSFYKELDKASEVFQQNKLSQSDAQAVQRAYEKLTQRQKTAIDPQLDLLAKSFISNDKWTGMDFFVVFLIMF